MAHEITLDFKMQRPLQEGDQAIVDAIEQIQLGERGEMDSDYIIRKPAYRVAGTFGEVVLGCALNEAGQQEVAFVDVQPKGILVGIDTREPGSRNSGEKQVALPTGSDVNSPEAQAIKIEAARRITVANLAVKNNTVQSYS